MKRLWLAAFLLASTLGIAHAQNQTFHFGEGQTGVSGAAPSPHHRRAVHKRRHSRHAGPARSGIHTHA
ncbi:hypothetical protein [Burkholderia cenocepacia]|uniref:Uncharacterized protein n=1 Tax=Burkholderia cenocepacia TaxID=95486 RepID=A0A6B2MDT8_9BURK|nr:hypothetical protein [Burkholderia cenocepacia]NDV72872.1 hypothetical protein [Burkholderia cenocepacia]